MLSQRSAPPTAPVSAAKAARWKHQCTVPNCVVSLQVCYPKRTDKPLFHGLVKQCEAHGIGFVEPEQLPSEPGKLSERADVVVDSLFGFSFKVQGL